MNFLNERKLIWYEFQSIQKYYVLVYNICILFSNYRYILLIMKIDLLSIIPFNAFYNLIIP